MRLRLLSPLVCLLLCATARVAAAEVLQMPVGGKPILIGDGRIACGPAGGGFAIEAGGRALRPPSDASAIGQAVELRVAAQVGGCIDTTTTITVIATGRWPTFESPSVIFSPDDGRIDARGRGFEGAGIVWQSGERAGVDVCYAPEADAGSQRCTWAAGGGETLPVDATFSFLPSGARAVADAVFFDASGRRAQPGAFVLTPARTILRRLLTADATVDLSTGRGEVPLAHPEAVASAECRPLQCEMTNGALVVRGASNLVSSLEVKLRLLPHVFFVSANKDTLEPQPTAKLPVLHCPMSVVSGAPIRSNDDAKVVVKLQGGCARDLASVRFATEHDALDIVQSTTTQDGAYVLLKLGNVGDSNLTLTALRGEGDGIALAVAHMPTRPPPRVRATIELPGFPNLSFVPNNRSAVVHVSAATEHEHYALLSIDGVYTASEQRRDSATIRGDANAAGLTELRFGLRNEALPPPFDLANLAEVEDPLQRSVQEANIPAPIGASVMTERPLIEMLCGAGKEVVRVSVGITDHLPFGLRDTCRVVFHRERLSPEFGTQKINFEVDVMRSDGSTRGEAHIAEVITLRAGNDPRYAWLHGVVEPFDRIVVRVSQEADEAHYMGAAEIKTGAPAAQWSAVLGTGHIRLYGTTAIPTGLYRFSDRAHSGVLSLNFGVISRLTWLDSEGHEGFLGVEGGIMVIGLANSTSDTGQSLTQVGAVFGLGVSVPIANRSTITQASINLHAWVEADITRSGSSDSAGRYAVIFGPSISIGNVGVNL